MDIVTEVSPADAARVEQSEHAELVAFDANRVLVGIVNRHAADVPLDDRRVRQALNLAVDKDRVIAEGLAGHANPLVAMRPSWCSGFPPEAKPYLRDPERARALLEEAGWPEGVALRLVTPGDFEGVAKLVAADVEDALGLAVELIVVPPEQLPAGARALVEKKLELPWHVLMHFWFDLSSEVPPAAVHREFFGSDGAFRAGPEVPQFDRPFASLAAETDPERVVPAAERLDELVFDEALGLFLCAPRALYAVNRHVRFAPYRTTFELAETGVTEDHWSRRDGS